MFIKSPKVVKVVFTILASFIMMMPAFAGTFYVRPDGNDANSGTENTPSGAWATIQKAANTLQPGDTAEIQSGTYNEAVKITNSGAPDQYIVFRANGEVVINAKGSSVKLDGANYIRLEGITCKSATTAGISLLNSNNNILVRNVTSSDTDRGIKMDSSSTDNQLIGNIASQDSPSQSSSSTLISTVAVASAVSDSLPVSVIPTAAGSISGKVTLQGRTDHQGLITFRLTIPGESTPFMTYEINTASDGSYSLNDVPSGIYNLSAKHQIFLRQNQVLIEVIDGQANANVNFSLLGADADNNNVVSLVDFAIMRAAKNTIPGDPKWDPRADFNGNNQIDLTDFAILRANSGKSGAEPQITITVPQDNTFTNVSSITVSGTINDSACQVTVNNIPAQVANNTFTAQNVPLVEGQNSISAIATNTIGNKNADLHTLILDTTPPAQPTINTLTSPTNIDSQVMTGTKSADSASVIVTSITATPEEVSYPTQTTWSCTLANLIEGTNDITITALDAAGNESSAVSNSIVLDTVPPSIDIYIPDANVTTRSSIVYGRVSDDTQTVTVNGTLAEILADFRFIARPSLSEGTNTITVQAQDQATNTNQASTDVIYNTQTPKVIITSPVDNSTQDISPISAQGTNITDLSFILVNTSIALIDSSTFTAEGVILDTIKTVITATGYDVSKNKFQDAIVVNSPNLVNYELIKVLGDARENDPARPSAGLNHILKAKAEKNSLIAINEEIRFIITRGNGALSSSSAYTDVNGETQVILTTDTNSDITNEVKFYAVSNPLVKTTFYVDTKPAVPAILTKIIDGSVTPIPGTTIPLIVKLTDSNNNPIQDETINFQVISGDGTLSSSTAVTTYYGEAKVDLTCPNLGLVLTQIQASSSTVPSVAITFNIATSAPVTLTVQDVIDKINYNESKIQDVKAGITVSSNAEFLPSIMQLKIWQKGDKQKVQEISPNSGIQIRPSLETIETIQMDQQIISYDTNTGICILKSKVAIQTEEKPYELWYVDYNKGVILKEEGYYSEGYVETLFVTEYSELIQLSEADNAWVYNKKIEKIYEGQNNLTSTTTITITNRQVNTGIPDSEFQ